MFVFFFIFFFFFNDTATTEIYTLSLHDALPIYHGLGAQRLADRAAVLAAAYEAHPERFPHGVPTPGALPRAVWINKPVECGCGEESHPVGSAVSADHERARDGATPKSELSRPREEAMSLVVAH